MFTSKVIDVFVVHDLTLSRAHVLRDEQPGLLVSACPTTHVCAYGGLARKHIEAAVTDLVRMVQLRVLYDVS